MEPGILDSLLTFIAAVGGSYLVFRGQVAKVRADAQAERDRLLAERDRLRVELERVKSEREAATRDDRREDFRAITDSQQAQIKQLQDMVAYLRGVAGTNERAILDLTRENGALREKLADLETRLARRELCPYAREGKCPLGLVAVTVDGKE